MHKNYLFFVCLFASASAGAQITVTSADIPNPGDSVRVSVANTTGGMDHTLTGAGFNWDFSALAPNVQRFEKFDAPANYPSVFPFVFFASSYGKENYQDTAELFTGFSVNEAYDFFKESTVNFRQVGIGYVINGNIPLLMQYSKPDTIYEFPMNFGDTSSCDFKFATPSSASIPFYYSESGHRESFVDGWGDLTTPFGTFPTLRIKSVITAIDSIYVDTLGIAQSFPVPDRVEYKWLVNGMKVPVLQITASDLAGTEVITEIAYQDSLRAGVPQIGVDEAVNQTSFTIYPNPSSSEVTIAFNLQTSSEIKISIVNSIGQTQTLAENSFLAGKQLVSVHADELNLSPGIYFVVLENGGSKSVKKMVLTK